MKQGARVSPHQQKLSDKAFPNGKFWGLTDAGCAMASLTPHY
ncbi:unnamed protein product (macronuclear) [Paramecium tetraurelia]|uniref:Uncharacterized protein n=1 Tax=Paramecium tetraurelia TaxID=5888 RepID=A0CG65_PARTE|nr:uncharacterized protein GSPATT00038227001 [Paramecium tetraurelia]CAK69782.1 unnamed protein product [Paramecium tetraurelia]|eukprot:XP_001437179.1 hypothetical protein (macronuclear) [Paramecium tetraurelia strain d4-2]